jgi:PAS domain S-box-containing protein
MFPVPARVEDSLEKPGSSGSPPEGPWPSQGLRALQVDELYRYAPAAAAFSYLIAVLTLGVLVDIGDPSRGVVWFLGATAIAAFRFIGVILYRRRDPASSPELWGRLVIAANLAAGIQWGVLGTILFPQERSYAQLYVVLVITCFVGGSIVAYAPLRWAHEALSIPAGVPLAVNLFFLQDGVHGWAGLAALGFCAAVVYYGRKHTRHLEEAFKLQIDRDELNALVSIINQKLEEQNRELAHRLAMRGVSASNAREIADRMVALFENSPLPQIECDSHGTVITCNAAAERLFGERRDALAGRPLRSLFVGVDAALAEDGARHAMTVEVSVRATGGEAVACMASFTPVPATADRLGGFGLTLYGLPVTVA